MAHLACVFHFAFNSTGFRLSKRFEVLVMQKFASTILKYRKSLGIMRPMAS